jgi:hypothetical protein
MNIPLDESRKVSESLQHELRQRGEQIVQLSGALAGALNKQSGVHANLQRCAKQFASLQQTMDATAQLLGQLASLNEQLRDQTALLVESCGRVTHVLEASDACVAMCQSVAVPARCVAAVPQRCAVCHPELLSAAEQQLQQMHATELAEQSAGSSLVYRSARSPRRAASTDVLRMAFDPADDEEDEEEEEVAVVDAAAARVVDEPPPARDQ